jgi:hypothetical protein
VEYSKVEAAPAQPRSLTGRDGESSTIQGKTPPKNDKTLMIAYFRGKILDVTWREKPRNLISGTLEQETRWQGSELI